MSAMSVISVQDHDYGVIFLNAAKLYSAAVKSLTPNASKSDVDDALLSMTVTMPIIKTALEQMRDLDGYYGKYANGDDSLYNTLGIWYALYDLARPYMPGDAEHSFTGAARALTELFDLSMKHVSKVAEMIYRPVAIDPDTALLMFAYSQEEIPMMRNRIANQAVLHICDLLQNRPIIKADFVTVVAFSHWHYQVYHTRAREKVFQVHKE